MIFDIDENKTLTVVEYLTNIGHRLITTNSSSNKYRCACPSCGSDSFSISDDRNKFKCFSCEFHGGGVGAARKQLDDVAQKYGIGSAAKLAVKHARDVRAKNVKTEKMVKTQEIPWQGATVRQLCEAKGIDYEYAIGTLGWQDTTYGRANTPAVAIPYFDFDGKQIDTRYRVGISIGTRMVSRKGTHVMPYGLQNLSHYRSGNYIILQEGETDWATLDALAYNALGIPGVNSFKGEWAMYLRGIRDVYVWQEAGGKPDSHGRTPGQQMVHRISSYQGKVWVMESPPEGKDPCELRQKLGDDAFRLMIDQMMLDAKPYDALEIEAAERKAERTIKPTAVHRHSHSNDDAQEDAPRPRLADATWTRGSSFDVGRGCGGRHHKANKVARNIGKRVNLTSLVFGHRLEFIDQNPEIVEFYSLSTLGVKLCDFCIFMDDPRRNATQEEMVNLVTGALGQVDLSGQPVPAYLAIVDCGRESVMNCEVHGAAYGGTHKCYQGFDPNCGTQASSQASKIKMPNLEGSANYYHVVYETIDELPENADHWGPIFSKQIDAWQKVILKVSGWKASKDRLYSRSHATYYGVEEGRTFAVTTWKVLFHEVEEGCLNEVIGRIADAMGAIVVDERRWQIGQTATLQIVSDFMSHFIGIDRSISMREQSKIFLAHYNSTRGRHIFQAYGSLRKLIMDLPEPEAQICPVEGCGLKLKEVLVPKPTTPGSQPKSQSRQY